MLVALKEPIIPFGADRSQAAPNQHPVKSGQNSEQMTGEFRDKLFHGASLLPRCSVLAERQHLIENRSAFHFWLRLRRAVLNSEKRNTEATKIHREPQSARAATKKTSCVFQQSAEGEN